MEPEDSGTLLVEAESLVKNLSGRNHCRTSILDGSEHGGKLIGVSLRGAGKDVEESLAAILDLDGVLELVQYGTVSQKSSMPALIDRLGES